MSEMERWLESLPRLRSTFETEPDDDPLEQNTTPLPSSLQLNQRLLAYPLTLSTYEHSEQLLKNLCLDDYFSWIRPEFHSEPVDELFGDLGDFLDTTLNPKPSKRLSISQILVCVPGNFFAR